MNHIPYECPPDCGGCLICDGGLFLCIRCDGAEGSLPTECPGTLMTADQQDAVHAGDLDYKDGHFVEITQGTPDES